MAKAKTAKNEVKELPKASGLAPDSEKVTLYAKGIGSQDFTPSVAESILSKNRGNWSATPFKEADENKEDVPSNDSGNKGAEE